MMLRASSIAAAGPPPYDSVVLTHDERHLRRRLLTLGRGETMLIELAAPTRLVHGDRLVLDDGRHVEVIAAEEPLLAVRATDPATLARLAWHLGNRHARIEIGNGALTLLPDHVLADMIAGLGGATTTMMTAPFEPEPPRLTGIAHHHAHD